MGRKKDCQIKNISMFPDVIALTNLTEPQRLFAYRTWAEFKSAAKVCELLKKEFGLELSQPTIRTICTSKSAMPFVQQFRDEFLIQVKQVPIANKRIRLEELDNNRQELNLMKDQLSVDDKSDRGELLMVQRRLNETICIAREEIEGKPLIMQQFNISQFSSLTDDELQKRKEDLLNKEIKLRQSTGAVEVIDVTR